MLIVWPAHKDRGTAVNAAAQNRLESLIVILVIRFSHLCRSVQVREKQHVEAAGQDFFIFNVCVIGSNIAAIKSLLLKL